MNYFNPLTLCAFLMCAGLPIGAAADELHGHCSLSAHPLPGHPSSTFGTAGFSTTNPELWYTINTHSYPDAVALSLHRNKGSAEGSVFLAPTGFTVGEEGHYWVSITAILQNDGTEAALIPVFLALDENFNADDPIGGVVALAPNELNSLHGTGTLKNVPRGTRLSLVATNAGHPFPQSIKVAAWSISLFRIP